MGIPDPSPNAAYSPLVDRKAQQSIPRSGHFYHDTNAMLQRLAGMASRDKRLEEKLRVMAEEFFASCLAEADSVFRTSQYTESQKNSQVLDLCPAHEKRKLDRRIKAVVVEFQKTHSVACINSEKFL